MTKPSVLIDHAPAAAEPSVVESEPDPAPEPVEPVVVESAAARYERERVDAWIRNRLIAYPLASCLLCRKPIIAGAGLGGSFERRGESTLSSDLSRRMAY